MKIQRKWHFSFSPLMHPSIISCCCSVQSKLLHRKAWQESARRLSGSFGGILYLISPTSWLFIRVLVSWFHSASFFFPPLFAYRPSHFLCWRNVSAIILLHLVHQQGSFHTLSVQASGAEHPLYWDFLLNHVYCIKCTGFESIWNWSCLLFLGLNDRC